MRGRPASASPARAHGSQAAARRGRPPREACPRAPDPDSRRDRYTDPQDDYCAPRASNSAVLDAVGVSSGGEMSYFVTGATGFIGRNLVERLLEREGTI